jgi:arginine dihydrolase
MTKSVLLCTPEHFDIEYEINPWMHQTNQVNSKVATEQWQKLKQTYTDLGWQVDVMPSVEGLPDLVFATDSAVIVNDKVFVSNFRYQERRPEAAVYERWLRHHGNYSFQTAQAHSEGGDILLCGDIFLAGHGFRSDQAAHRELQTFFGLDVLSLKLVDPCFYHLDTALAVLSPDCVAVYPEAFDGASLQQLQQRLPKVIAVSREEALSFGLNVVSDGRKVIMSSGSPSLEQKYQAAGLEVIAIDTGEFTKSGGGVHCLSLLFERV